MKRLCFGTFIDVLMQCRKGITKTSFIDKIISTVAPDHEYKTNSKEDSESVYRALNHLYKCTGDFTTTYSNIKQLSHKIKKNTVVSCFEEDVIPCIDEDRCELVVLALCDIIKHDSTLNYKNGGENVKKFQKYFKNGIKDLINSNEYVLSEFLVGIFLYTVNETDNKVGEEWLKSICAKEKYEDFFQRYVMSFKEKADTIQVWRTKKEMKKGASHNTAKQEKSEDIHPNQIGREEKSENMQSAGSISNIQIDSFSAVINEAELHIPKCCKICACCTHWKGISPNAHKSETSISGYCLGLKKDVKSCESCNYFIPD